MERSSQWGQLKGTPRVGWTSSWVGTLGETSLGMDLIPPPSSCDSSGGCPRRMRMRTEATHHSSPSVPKLWPWASTGNGTILIGH